MQSQVSTSPSALFEAGFLCWFSAVCIILCGLGASGNSVSTSYCPGGVVGVQMVILWIQSYMDSGDLKSGPHVSPACAFIK